MNPTGAAIYFDGETTTRQSVTVEVAPGALLVRDGAGRELAAWPYGELEEISSHDGVLRVGRAGTGSLARIEVRDAALATAIDDLSLPVDRSGMRSRRSRRRIVLWSIAAVGSLLTVGTYGVPLLATQLAPHVPLAMERRLGQTVETQVRAMLDPAQSGRGFECGWKDGEAEGRAALQHLVARLETAAALPIPLSLVVVKRKEANAVALPGGHIYVFEGLIEKANSADEVAGVIAHEIGHVAHRDGTRSILQAAGLSFLFGLVLGDFFGGGAVIVAAKTILQLAYSREVERAADSYAVGLMTKAGGDPVALAAILTRIAGNVEPGARILANHPDTRERVEAIRLQAKQAAGGPILTAAEWSALRRICAAQ